MSDRTDHSPNKESRKTGEYFLDQLRHPRADKKQKCCTNHTPPLSFLVKLYRLPG